MCQTTSENNKICSFFFIGFGFGLLLFFLPDTFGRKYAFNCVLPFHLLGNFLTVYGNTAGLKSLGFFIMGVFHLKITLSYTYILELVEETKKPMASTIINAFDSSSNLITCLILLFFTKNEDTVMRGAWFVGLVGYIIFIVICPESPRWLFM